MKECKAFGGTDLTNATRSAVETGGVPGLTASDLFNAAADGEP